MLKKPASFVLRNLGASTYLPCTPRRLNSLRPCWTGFLSILRLLSLPIAIHLTFSSLLIMPPAYAATVDVYYAPEDLPADRLILLYSQAKHYIYVAVYTMTFPPIVKAL